MAKRKLKTEQFDGFYSHGRLIYFENPEVFHEDPFRLIRVFLYAQQREMELSPELQQLIRRRTRLVNRTFQYARAARETFQAILSRKGQVGHILRMMHEVDFLGKYLPEFGELTCLVQHEFFHRYTADEHTLVCIEKLDSLIDTEDPKLAPYSSLFLKLEDPYVLYLALLLHDTGKASGARHHAEASALNAQKVAARLQLSPERRRKLILAGGSSHDALRDRATPQPGGFGDDRGFRGSGAESGKPRCADAADFGRWSRNRRAELVRLEGNAGLASVPCDRQLFTRRTRIFRRTADRPRRPATGRGQENVERLWRKRSKCIFNSMPDRYFQSHNVNEIVGHLRLFRSFVELRVRNPSLALSAAVKWHSKPDQGHSEFWICTWDRAALMAKIAGSFATASINILSADVYTRVDNLMLAIFRVCDTSFRPVSDERDLQQVESVLQASLEKIDYDFTPLMEKARKRTAFHLPIGLDLPTKLMISNEIQFRLHRDRSANGGSSRSFVRRSHLPFAREGEYRLIAYRDRKRRRFRQLLRD